MNYRSFINIRKWKLFLVVYCFLVSTASGQDFGGIQSLIARRLPELKGKVVLKGITGEFKTDSAIYYTKGAKLFIEANTLSAASFALNDYLKKYCNSSFSHTGDNVHIPEILPQTNKHIIVSAVYPVRYALNYCTYNYTMSFWGWKEWEKELDWMSLNGVNLMLAPIGNELIWQKTLKDFGFNNEEIKQYIPGPAFNAWWLMGNLEGWGGPVSDEMIAHWSELQKKLLPRMRELGIQPVMQGFWGMVPTSLKKHFPGATIIDQGKWAGGFERPSMLAPQDSLFAKMSTVYYKYMKQLYGSDVKYLGGDLFHEGGNTGGLDIKETGKLIQADMQKNFPGSVWVLQGWQDNPKPALLGGLDRSKTLVLDLMGDRADNWEKRNGYDHFPWIWCTITNFGGKPILEGKLLRVITEPKRASGTTAGSTFRGVGIIPEGIENNDIIYDWTLASAWQKHNIPVQENLANYIKARYGQNNSDIYEGWQYLLQSVYIDHSLPDAGGYESILCARPDTNMIASVSTWGSTQLPYDPELLLQAALDFSKAAGQFKNIATYRYDLVDIWRQVIAIKAREDYEGFMLAYKRKDKAAFQKYKNLFIGLLNLQDKWTGTNPAFMVGRWINSAKEMLPNPVDKRLSEWNARTQITYWGSNSPNTDLHEYAYKEWSGIIKDLYLLRWVKFFDYAEAKMDNKEAIFPDFFGIEKHWTEQRNEYSTIPEYDSFTLLPLVIKTVTASNKADDGKTPDFFKKED
ncbi:alpha-N-acetylglucosaminidase [Mucilaginibacter sp. X5P1]|uniref:alpha-N-acetylglucosaminidase n=1 Tax=Mucilaginibacter sp. X5P1 TaxID=2723088 RepID=UPI00160B470F|nr:alpha-N-acetylglucosaminidase [Mucilaginibacter sp. X5P1]MBB6139852.1 alpha-N-acetylglucosaminidase [Mucilaginibacter sp. X5P1]